MALPEQALQAGGRGFPVRSSGVGPTSAAAVDLEHELSFEVGVDLLAAGVWSIARGATDSATLRASSEWPCTDRDCRAACARHRSAFASWLLIPQDAHARTEDKIHLEVQLSLIPSGPAHQFCARCRCDASATKLRTVGERSSLRKASAIGARGASPAIGT
jgi:hypothetical protein